MLTPLETYLAELRMIRSTGAAQPETSFYTPLANLLNEIGKTLKPRVRCILQLANRGAGMPDGGLFAAEQVRGLDDRLPLGGQIPSRGVIEAKPVSDDSWLTATGKQVTKYGDRYGLVLVTNYRDFVLVGKGEGGKLRKMESFRLADSEATFWNLASHPNASGPQLNVRFVEFLKRVLLQAAPLTDPKDLAWFLASYARDAAARLEGTDLPALASLRSALEDSLGLRFEGEKGDHFFRSTLVQTLFYGVFSAWVLWSREMKDRPAAKFDWRVAGWTLHVPMIRTLFEQIAAPTRLEPLGLVEVLDWAASALNRVDRNEFFRRFEDEHAVPYFYEPFLAAFDPDLRKQLGVWYTPPEIVEYMVERVDRVLRKELGVRDGFADRRVIVLDPACGTGAYLVEVLRRIEKTLSAAAKDALIAADVKKAARDRIFGFEILPAPFVVSHLQIGLHLSRIGAPLSEGNERASVYLTNALTGWEPPAKERGKPIFPEMAEERDAADHVKRDAPIIVVLGNPPYNAFAGVTIGEESDLVEPYKRGLASEWNIKKFNLDDLYTKFFRLAERKITERPPFMGVVSFISNFSYLRDPSFVVMRKRFVEEFDAMWFDCLNGDSRETGKLTPDGRPDPSVFSTDANREGIRVGTAISLLVRSERHNNTRSVWSRQFWGETKRQDLLDSLGTMASRWPFERVQPTAENRFSFHPTAVGLEYSTWPRVVDLSLTEPITGFKENRGFSLIDLDRETLANRMREYFDPSIDWEHLAARGTGLTHDAARFDAKKARANVLRAEEYQEVRLQRYFLRPFEDRWCYYSPVRPLWNEPRPSLYRHLSPDNSSIVTRPAAVSSPEGAPFYFTRCLSDFDAIRGHTYNFPIMLTIERGKPTSASQPSLQAAERLANLSPAASSYLESSLGLKGYPVDELARTLWLHTLAIGYSPTYLSENADGVRGDWPRIPLPNSKEILLSSASLGHRLGDLLDVDLEVDGVTAGTIRPEFRGLGVISKVGGGQLDELADLAVTAGWGHTGKEGATMPGKGKFTERAFSEDERNALGSFAVLLGNQTLDVFLNGSAYWRNVPLRVWEYYIGGYQVVKKWLSYRERDLLGRDLRLVEARYFTQMVRRLAAIVLLEPELDRSYQASRGAPYPWPGDQ